MPESEYFTYRGVTLAYRVKGKGKPLIILHGWGTDSGVMESLAQGLSDLRTCYLLDLPGFGKSSLPDEPWSIDDYADLVSAFSYSLAAEKIDFLAHSFGGRIVLKLCARPFGKKKADKILITGGAGMKPRRNFSFYLKKYTAKLLKAPFYLLPEKFRDQAISGLRKTRIWKSLGSPDYQKLDGIMRETFVKTVTEHLESSLVDISNEVLLLWGRNDESTPLYQAERMQRGIRNAELVIIDHAGHYAFLDRPSHFNSIAKAFFSDP